MYHSAIASTIDELEQILILQSQNLQSNISAEEIKQQGFVTVHHTPESLKAMNDIGQAIIIKENEKVVAYALTMFTECRALVPALDPMFANFEKLKWKGKALKDYRFYVMGQICVDKQHRGKGLVEMLYQKHKEVYSPSFDLIVTEIATRNHRSLRAHEKIGFQTINIYKDETDEWAVVAWEWS